MCHNSTSGEVSAFKDIITTGDDVTTSMDLAPMFFLIFVPLSSCNSFTTFPYNKNVNNILSSIIVNYNLPLEIHKTKVSFHLELPNV